MLDGEWAKIGETEQIDNDLNPDFKTPIKIMHYFTKVQKLKFVINDVDTGDDQELIGSREVTLGAILHAKNSTWMERLEFQGSEKHRGIILVRAETVQKDNKVAKFRMQWSNVRQTKSCMGLCGKSTPVRYCIDRKVPGIQQFATLKQSYPFKAKTFTTSTEIQFLSNLCNNNKESPIKFALKNDASTKEICSI